jgi:DNA-binding response OmpR family regulator
MKHLTLRQRVLLVAGELDLRARFARELQSFGYAVELASDMKRALRLTADEHFRVAIVAPGPNLASLGMVLALRGTVPKMIVIAEGSNEITHLRRSLPAVDEFILKSANEGALATRVGEMMAVADSGDCVSVPRVVHIEDCKLDLGGYVFVTPDGSEVTLTRAETDLLKELVRNPCQVVSRDKLRCAVAGRDMDPFDRSVDMLVARVRRKIEPDPKVPRFLLTVPGVGYKLITRTQPVKVRQLGPGPTEPDRQRITALNCKLVDAMGPACWPKAHKDDTERVMAAFALMDSDGDGTVSLQEFQVAYERMFKAIDADNDGTLTLEEVRTFMSAAIDKEIFADEAPLATGERAVAA